MRVIVAPDDEALAREAAERITTLVERACAERGSAVICLTGGSTPRRLYAMLGDADAGWARRIDWSRVHLFWGDERHVPPDHPDSNFGMAWRELICRVPVPEAQVHRMRGEPDDPGAAAREYEQSLRDGFAAAGRHDCTFDVMLLGIGADAHIASIFPGSPLLETEGGTMLVASVREPNEGRARITLTPRALLDSLAIVVLAAGSAKANAIHAAIAGEEDVRRWPAQLLRRAGERVEWHLDRAAAARLE